METYLNRPIKEVISKFPKVPCCMGLVQLVKQALESSKRKVPLKRWWAYRDKFYQRIGFKHGYSCYLLCRARLQPCLRQSGLKQP
jgi:hypothetical protein